MGKDNDPRLAEVLEKIKDPRSKQQFFEKVQILPKKQATDQGISKFA